MPIALGLFLGFANVVVIGWGLDFMSSDPYHTFDVAFGYGLVPGLVTGGGLGWMAGRTSVLDGRLRLLIVTPPALIVVWWLASTFKLEAFAPFASVTTLVGCVILERRTRKKVESMIPEAVALAESFLRRLGAWPAAFGSLLGALDVLVVALLAHGLGVRESFVGSKGDVVPIASATIVFGLLPAMLSGALLGRLAARMRLHTAGERLAALCLLSLIAVTVLAGAASLDKPAVLALLPTVVGVLVLERATRVPGPR